MLQATQMNIACFLVGVAEFLESYADITKKALENQGFSDFGLITFDYLVIIMALSNKILGF